MFECGSWLASDAGDPVSLRKRGAAIAGKPAPTGLGTKWHGSFSLSVRSARSAQGLFASCLNGGSWLASDAGDPVSLHKRGAAIAGKPAPTGDWAPRAWIISDLVTVRCDRSAQRLFASCLNVGAGLPAMQATLFSCASAVQSSAASRLPQEIGHYVAWIIFGISALRPLGPGAFCLMFEWWELACQRCR